MAVSKIILIDFDIILCTHKKKVANCEFFGKENHSDVCEMRKYFKMWKQKSLKKNFLSYFTLSLTLSSSSNECVGIFKGKKQCLCRVTRKSREEEKNYFNFIVIKYKTFMKKELQNKSTEEKDSVATFLHFLSIIIISSSSWCD